jgi:hypothetical protein
MEQQVFVAWKDGGKRNNLQSHVCLSVHLSEFNNSKEAEQIFMKSGFGVILLKYDNTFRFGIKSDNGHFTSIPTTVVSARRSEWMGII